MFVAAMLQEHHSKGAILRQIFDPSMAFSKIEKHSLFEAKNIEAYKKLYTYDPSRAGFFDLPGELRNQIYRLALTQYEPINGILTKLPAIQVMRSCKQVHDEASSVLYEENTFTFGIEINWTRLQRMRLYGFPSSLAIWPAPAYHRWLRKLYIQISFTPGNPNDHEAPVFLRNDIAAMRKAYDDCWDDLEITYDLCEGTAHLLTFTMAWLKFRFFEPIAHPNCQVKTNDKVPALVRWCLEKTLQQRDLKSTLGKEQLFALRDAREIAEDSYNSDMYRCITDLSHRLVWGAPFDTTSMTQLQPGGLFGPPPFLFGAMPGGRRRIYDKTSMYMLVNNSMTNESAREILLEDNELRTFAALEMPHEKDLLIKGCCELRTSFALQEAAMKIAALTRSLNE
jgi:hypothetical protein